MDAMGRAMLYRCNDGAFGMTQPSHLESRLAAAIAAAGLPTPERAATASRKTKDAYYG